MGVVGDSGDGKEARELIILSPGSTAQVVPEGALPPGALRGRLNAPQMAAGGVLTSPTSSTGRLFSKFADQTPTTQNELQAGARRVAAPAVRTLLAGGRQAAFNPGASTGQRLFSPQQLAQLTRDEQEALRSRLAVDNQSMDDFIFAQEQRFRNPRKTARARLSFR